MKKPERLAALDLLRGSAIALMALDHARDFVSEARFDPTDLERTRPALFVTRWLTHLCAPTFILLAGAAARLSLQRERTAAEASRFLASRGLFLVALEVTLVRFEWMTAEFEWLPISAGVLWVLGWSMVILAGLLHLPLLAVAIFGAAQVFLHDIFDAATLPAGGALRVAAVVLHGGHVFSGDKFLLGVPYSLVPWSGLMALGWVLGTGLSRWTERERRQRLFAIGGGLVALFLALRAANLYGDPQPWSAQPDAWRTVASFLNCRKYPPSLSYLCMTLGPMLLLAPLLERLRGRAADVLLTFGRASLFFYLLHLALLHLFAFALAALAGQPLPFAPSWSWPADARMGFSLPVVYGVWIAALALLHPACRAYAAFKRRRDDWWLSYV